MLNPCVNAVILVHVFQYSLLSSLPCRLRINASPFCAESGQGHAAVNALRRRKRNEMDEKRLNAFMAALTDDQSAVTMGPPGVRQQLSISRPEDEGKFLDNCGRNSGARGQQC